MTKKIIRYLAALILTVIFVVGIVTMSYLPSLPTTSVAPIIIDYLPLKETVTTTLNVATTNFNRLDLYLNNNNLINHDWFQYRLSQADGTVLTQGQFSGDNVGFKTALRLDLDPAIVDHPGENLQLTIAPVTQYDLAAIAADEATNGIRNRDGQLLEYGITSADDITSVASMSYDEPAHNLATIKQQVIARLKIISQQIWWLWLILLIILWFAV